MYKLVFLVAVTVLVAILTEAIAEPNPQQTASDPAKMMQDSVPVNDEGIAGNITMDIRSGADPRCPVSPIPPIITNPSLPSITLSSNCDFCDHDLYSLTCIPNAFTCAARCAADRRCTHFTYIANLNGGTCRLKSAPGSGGAWAVLIPAPSAYICGYIPRRAFTSILLSLCLGLDINIGIL